MDQQPYTNLLVWQKADEFLQLVYIHSGNFPKEEMFGVTSQLRRAALSVVLNIVEGRARQSGNREYLRFLLISRSSLAECSYLISFSRKQKYLNENQFNELEYKLKNVSYFLNQTIKSINKNNNL
jgi:four helix bundle protein